MVPCGTTPVDVDGGGTWLEGPLLGDGPTVVGPGGTNDVTVFGGTDSDTVTGGVITVVHDLDRVVGGAVCNKKINMSSSEQCRTFLSEV